MEEAKYKIAMKGIYKENQIVVWAEVRVEFLYH